MNEKRHESRFKERVQVRYGEQRPVKIGFTDDLSPKGFFIKTATIFAPKTELKIDLCLPGGETVSLEGTVRWAKRTSPDRIRLGQKGGMGIHVSRFVSGEEEYLRHCAEIQAKRMG
ncbi:PilZ domain-containing protein [Desulfuromonas sp.]|uniref:PilZ domain-containing protein n=1 Tax=Desulfuromonas sp. TaxID=892 RepID=UPI0025BA916B|nr:PilZ domain-containing protein [Desulfuromonas sp.]